MPRLFISSRKHKVFNDRDRKVYRKRISGTEVAFSVFFVGFVVAMGWWFLSKRSDYDPSERDISMAILEEDSVEDNLYRTPLQRWIDPAAHASGASPTGVADLAPFPAGILDDEWEPSSRLQHFDEDTLYEKINGAAPQYYQFGFVQLHYISIKKGEDEISIELYDMGQLQNALGIFAAQRDADIALSTLDKTHYYLTEVGALGIVGQYYFKLSGTSGNPAIINKTKLLIPVLGALAGAGAPPPKPYQVLAETLGIPFDGIVFEREDVFQYSFAKDFWFGKADPASNEKYYLHEAGSEEEAKALYEQLLENNLFDFDVVTQSDDEVVLKHKFLSTFQSLSRKGSILYGVDGAPDPESAAHASKSLEAALTDEPNEEEAYSAS